MIESLKRGKSDPMRMLSILSDFSLLIELANVVGADSIVDICSCILNKKPLSNEIMVTCSVVIWFIVFPSNYHGIELWFILCLFFYTLYFHWIIYTMDSLIKKEFDRWYAFLLISINHVVKQKIVVDQMLQDYVWNGLMVLVIW